MVKEKVVLDEQTKIEYRRARINPVLYFCPVRPPKLFHLLEFEQLEIYCEHVYYDLSDHFLIVDAKVFSVFRFDCQMN